MPASETGLLPEPDECPFCGAPSHAALLAEALEGLLHAVCGETGFANAVRTHSGHAYPWEALDIAEERARAALEQSHGG